jgi:tetratricopeptide (TPR) repeat protein
MTPPSPQPERSEPGSASPAPAAALSPLARVGAVLLAAAGAGLLVLSTLLWSRIIGWGEKIEPLQREQQERQAVAAAAEDSSSAAGRVRLGIFLAQHGQGEAALVQLEAAHALAPEDANAAYSLGKLALMQGDTRQALPPLQAAAALTPGNPQARLHLGLAYLAVDQPEAARQEFEAALQHDASLVEARLGRALSLWSEPMNALAGPALQEAARQEVQSPLGRALQVRAWLALADPARAVAAGRAAAAAQPDSAAAWEALGEALVASPAATPGETEAALQRALELGPRSAAAYEALGRHFLRERQFARAVEAFQAVLRLDPAAPRLHAALAQALASAGREAEARAEGEAARRAETARQQVAETLAALAGRPADRDLSLRLARLYAAQGLYDWAAAALGPALRQSPADAALQRDLRLYQEMARE